MDTLTIAKWQSSVRESVHRIRALDTERIGDFSWVDIASQVEVLTARINAGNTELTQRKLDLVKPGLLQETTKILIGLINSSLSQINKDEVAAKRLLQVSYYFNSIVQAIDVHRALTQAQGEGKEVNHDQIVKLENLLLRQFEPYKIQLIDALEEAAKNPPSEESAEVLSLASTIRGWTAQPIDPDILQ